jgi:hypothetical protein
MAETFMFHGKEAQIVSLDSTVIEPISTFSTRSGPFLVLLMN